MANVELETEWDNLDAAFEALEDECSAIVRGITVEAWNNVLKETPQFYGRLAASWTYSINAPVFVDRSQSVKMSLGLDTPAAYATDPDEGDVFTGLWKGHPEAIGIANMASFGKESTFRLGDTVYFSNGADHGEGPYAADIEQGFIRLRPVNSPGKMASRAFDRAQARYGQSVSPRRVEYLKGLKIS